MTKKKVKIYFYITLFFVVILALGLFLRLSGIQNNPPGFFCDEASIGYNAYSILKTGTDEFGNKLPMFFRAFGEYKNPIDIYSTVPFVYLFGLNEIAVRLVSVFFSIMSMVVLFTIGKRVKNERLGLVLMLTYAITPWSIHISRINMEGMNHLIFFVLVGIFFLNEYYITQKNYFIFLSYIFFGFATYSYFPGRIVIPLFIMINSIVLLSVNKKDVFKKIFYPSIIYFLLLTPLFVHILLGNGLARWQQVSIFNNAEINPLVKIATSYILHYSPDFLFMKGDIGMEGQFITRHSVRGFGEFYLWQLPFIFCGVLYLAKKHKHLFYSVILLLLLYPLSSALTTDIPPQATRSVIGIIPFTILTGAGFFYIIDQLTTNIAKYIFTSCVSIICLAALFGYIKSNNQYRFYSADFWGWQYGPKEIIDYFKKETNNYDELYMTGAFNAPYIFLKFYDPERVCKNCFIGGIDRYNSRKKQLFALTPEEVKILPIKYSIKKIIYYPNGHEAFYVIKGY